MKMKMKMKMKKKTKRKMDNLYKIFFAGSSRIWIDEDVVNKRLEYIEEEQSIYELLGFQKGEYCAVLLRKQLLFDANGKLKEYFIIEDTRFEELYYYISFAKMARLNIIQTLQMAEYGENQQMTFAKLLPPDLQSLLESAELPVLEFLRIE